MGSADTKILSVVTCTEYKISRVGSVPILILCCIGVLGIVRCHDCVSHLQIKTEQMKLGLGLLRDVDAMMDYHGKIEPK